MTRGAKMNSRDKLIKSEMVEMFETTKEALRHYENVGLLHPEKDDKKYRFYGFKDMAKLRQLFVLKDLGFQLDEIKLIMNKEVSQDDFSLLLTKHNLLLKKKIKRYEGIQNNIAVVLKLLEEGKHNITFNLNEFDNRTFLMLDSKEILDETPRSYYERFKDVINEAYYNERVLISCYDYKMLESSESGFSKLCINISDLSADLIERDDIITKVYDAGMFLSVYYIFRHQESGSLGHIKKIVDHYILSNQLVIEDEEVLEFEHPELGMILDSDEELYEIQLKVRYKND